MSDKADLIFGVDTSQAVTSLQRLDKALKDTLYQMGKGSVAPFSQLTKGSKDASDAAKKAAKDLEALAKSSNKAAEQMVTYSQKVGNASYRVKVGLNETYTEAVKKMEDFNKALKDPSSFLNHQKRMMEDLKATQVWSKKRKDSLIELVNAEDSSRKKLLNSLRKDIEDRSKLQVAAHQFEASQLQKHLQTLTQASTTSRQKELAEMRRTIKEREQATRDHAREMMRIESNIAAQRRRQESLSMGYLESSLQSRLRTLQKIQALQESGNFSTSTIARRHGVEALGDLRNIENIQKQVALQREMEKIERQALSTKSQGAPVVGKNTAAILKNNKAMHDARGLARGLSGALGQLWLTYGSLAPLVAGAAIGSIARQTYQVGKDVEFRLAMLEALGNRAIQIQEMMPAVHGSMKTPLEAAQGLQELAQAGLSAEQSLAVLSTTLNLATLGEMSVAEAALTTTAALSTFNLQVSESIRVGDVFAKTASISNTTVQGIAESMKQAGSAAAIYGVEIEDVAAQVAILAQNGIRGSAAGTAVRNAMTELHAPTKKAQGIMKDLGIEIYNSDKTSRNYIEVLGDLRKTYYQLNEESQAAMLKGMFNERSRRFIQIAIKDYDKLREMLDKVRDSQGFLMMANLKLLDTIEGASNRMQSVLQQSMVEAFEKSKPQILEAIRNMEQLFASDEFKKGVTTITREIANLTAFATEHADTILKVGAAYVTWKLAIRPIIPLLAAMKSPLAEAGKGIFNIGAALGLTSASMATTAAASTKTAASAATLGSRFLTLGSAVIRFAGPFGLLLGTLATGYSLMNSYSRASHGAAGAQDTLESEVNRVTRALDLQNNEIRQNLKLRQLAAEGSSLEIHDTQAMSDRIRERQILTGQMLDKEVENFKFLQQFVSDGQREMTQDEQVWYGERFGHLTHYGKISLQAEMEASKKRMQVIGQEMTNLSGMQMGLNAKLQESAELNLKQHTANVMDEIGRLNDTMKVYAESNPQNKAIQNAYEGIAKLNEEYTSGSITIDEYKAKTEELNSEIQKNLGSWSAPETDKGMERAIERFDQWLQKQLLAIKTNKELIKAHQEGEESLKRYHLEQAIGEQIIKDKTKNYATIRKVLIELNKTQEQLKIAEETTNLIKSSKVHADYVKVLQAQSKGYEQGRKALSEFNREQALQKILVHSTKENVEELIEAFNKAWDQNEANERLNEDLRTINEYVESTKNSNEKYIESLKKLERMKTYDLTEKQVKGLDLAIRNLHIENNAFLSALNQGFTDLEKTAGGMWQQFFEEGRITMESTSKMFKRMLADMAHAAITKPIIISLQNMVMGTNVAGGWGDVWGGSGGTGGVGGSGGLLGVANTVKSGWDLFSGGMTSKVGGLIGNLGQKFGSSAMTSFANGMLGTFGSTAASSVGATIGSSALASMSTSVGTGAIANVAYSSTIGTTMGTAGAAANMGAMAGAALPWIGAAVAAFSVGKMIHNMFKGETRSGGGFVYDLDVDKTRFAGGPSGGYGGAEGLQMMDSTLKGFAGGITSLFDTLKITNVELANTIGTWESSTKGRGGTSTGGTLIIDGQAIHFGSIDNVTGASRKGAGYGGRTGTAEEMIENMAKDMSFSTLEAWKTVSGQLPKTLQQMLDVSIRDLSVEGATQLASDILAITEGVSNVSAALETLPINFLKGVGFDLTYTLGQVSGGFDNLNKNIGSYYDSFFTDAEKFSTSFDSLWQGLGDLNLWLPQTREGFRDLVDSLHSVTDQNVETAASLLGLADAAGQFYTVMENGYANFYSNFYPEQERLEMLHRDLTDSLTNLGMTLPQTRDGFRNLVDSLGDVNAANSQTIITLLGLSSSAHDYYSEIERAQERHHAETLRREQEAYQKAQSAVDRLMNQFRELAQKQIDELSKVGEKTDKIFSAMESKLNDQIRNLSGITSQLESSIRSLRGEVNKEWNEKRGHKTIDQALQTGKLPTESELRDAISDIQSGFNSKDYTSIFDREKDKLVLANKLEKLNELAGPQLSIAEQQLQVMKDQLAELREGAGRAYELANLTKSQISVIRSVDDKTGASVGLSQEQLLNLRTGNNLSETLRNLTQDQIVGILGVKSETGRLTGLSQTQLESMREVDVNTLTLAELTRRLQTALEAESVANQQIKVIQDQLTTMQKQYDQLRGLNSTMTSLDEGMRLLAKAMKAEQAAKPSTPSTPPTPAKPKFGDKDYKFTSEAEAKKYVLGNTGLLGQFATEVANGWTTENNFMKYAQYHYGQWGWSEGRSQAPKNLGRTHRPGTYTESQAYLANNQDILSAYLKIVKTDKTYAGDRGMLAYAQLHFDHWGKNEKRKYAQGGLHPGGMRLVGEFGPELEVTGPGRIHNVHRTQELLSGMGGSGNLQGVEQRLDALIYENQRLREENDRAIRALIEMNHRNVRMLERWETDGLPETRTWELEENTRRFIGD